MTQAQAQLSSAERSAISAAQAAVDAIEGSTATAISNSLAALGLNGDGSTNDKAALQALITARASAGIPLVLPKATYSIDISGGGLEIPLNADIRGNGATFVFKNPNISVLTRAMELEQDVADNVRIRDLTLSWPPGHESNKTNAILFARGISGLVLEDVVLQGWGQSQLLWNTICNPLSLFGCSNVRLRRVTAKWSVDGYGVDLLGVIDAVIDDCDFSYNGADGLKIHGDSTFGPSSRIRVRNTRMNYNGQMDIQGYETTLGTAVTSTFPSISHGGRYQVTSATGATVAFPDASTLTDGQAIVISRHQSATTDKTFTPASGDSFVNSTGNSDYISGANFVFKSTIRSSTLKFTSDGANTWTVIDIENGGGVDMTASRVDFEGCEAIGNESTGFQVKTTEASATSVAHDIVFDRCLSEANWTNGFGVVNAEGSEQAASVVPHSITWSTCTAASNLRAGFHLNGGTLGGQSATFIGCTARKNNAGFSLDDTFRYTFLLGCFAYENGGTTGTNFNVLIDRCNFWTLRDCVISGVDPVSQQLGTLSGVDGGTPAAYGVYLNTGATAMKRGVIDHCQIANHTAGRDISVYPNPAAFDLTVSGSPGDISIGANGDGVLYFGADTPQATLTTPSSSYGVLTFDN